MEIKVSWLASKGKPALEFAAPSIGARGWPKNPRAVAGPLASCADVPSSTGCRRSFEYGVLRLPSVLKAGWNQGDQDSIRGRKIPSPPSAPSASSAIMITILGRANRRPVQ